MGKVKIRVVGDEQAEKEQLQEQKKKREEKKQTKGLNMGGGQRINAVGVSEEEIAAQLEKPASGAQTTEETQEPKESKAAAARKKRNATKRIRSKRHTENGSVVAKKTSYPLGPGIELLRKFKKSNFDETVELHINVKEKGISGQVALPHGTGKQIRIKVADDNLIEQIEKGKIDFDILVATPVMMPKLAKVARILGPRGLMPNPKAGTITDKPEALIEKLSKGQVSYKTEAAAPLIHMSVGKLSFEDKKLEDNIKSVLDSIGGSRIDKVTLKSTMSPAIRIQI